MAKVYGPHQSPRAPSLRGAFLIRPGKSTQVAQAWPKPAKQRLSAKQREAIAKFKEAAIICKFAPPEDQMRSRQLAHGSQFLPRDLQYMAIYGRLATLYFTDGQRRYQLASRIELSELLDILGFQPGSVLTRGPEHWEALEPGPAGWVLTTGAEGEAARWAPGAEDGVTGLFDGATVASNQAGDLEDYLTKATLIKPRMDIIATSISYMPYQEGTNRPLAVSIWQMSGEDASALPVQAMCDPIEFLSPGSSAYIFRNEIPEPHPRLYAGVPYAVVVSTRRDPPLAVDMRYITPTNPNCIPNGPLDPLYRSFGWLTGDIVADQVPDRTRDIYYPAWLGGYIAPPED